MSRFSLPGKRVFIGFLLVLNVFLGYRLFVSGQGMFAYVELRQKHEALEERLKHMEKVSQDLSQEIRRLKSDRSYVESVIRSRMNYVGKDEILYVFPGAHGEKSPTDGAGAAQNADEN